MKQLVRVAMVLLVAVLVSGCVSAARCKAASLGDFAMSSAPGSAEAEASPERMLIWSASLGVEVWSVSNAVKEAVAVVEKQGGFVEERSDGKDKYATLTIRIPSKSFTSALAGLEALGTVTYRNIEGDDVTEKYVDIEARLKNKKVLRDRLTQLLDKATGVKDVLAIETELNRVQSDIDSMEAQIKSLKGQVEYSTVSLRLTRKKILGPLGYIFRGVFWGLEKLFVIRD